MAKLLFLVGSIFIQGAFAQHVAHSQHQSSAKSCPPGFELVGKQCTAVEVAPLISNCPHGTEQISESHCGVFAQSLEKCPAGFAHVESGCVKKTVAPSSPVCPPGFNQHGHSCSIPVEQEPHCPHGFPIPYGDKCAVEVHHLSKCPESFTASGKHCIRPYPASPVCPHDTVLDLSGKKCEKQVVGHPSCPHSYHFSEHKDKCQRFIATELAPCPVTYSQSPKNVEKCERVDLTPAEPVCTVGQLEADGETCQKSVPQTPFCPEGFTRGPSGECRKTTPQLVSCPAGFEKIVLPDGVACRKVINHKKIPTCPTGFELSKDKCKTVEYTPAAFRCPLGSRPNPQGECVKAVVSSPRLICPSGFDLIVVGNSNGFLPSKAARCVRTTSVDCSVKTTKEECTVQLPAPTLSKGRRLAGNPSVYVPTPAVPTSRNGKGVSCRTVEVVVPKTCEKEEVVAPESICADGSTPVAGKCSSDEVVPKEAVCKKSEGEYMDAEGRCFKVRVTSVQFVCPAATRDVGQSCTEVVDESPIYSCPAGYEVLIEGNAECVRYADLITPPDHVTRTPANFVCHGENLVLQGNQCAETKEVTRERVCRHGTLKLDEHKCVEVTHIIPPPVSTVHVAPNLVCADGSPAKGHQCFEETPDRDFFCAKGLITEKKHEVAHDGSPVTCLKLASLVQPAPKIVKEKASYVCPAGFSPEDLSHTHGPLKCIAVEHAVPEVFCPHGYEGPLFNEHSQKSCLKKVPVVVVCPPKFQKTHDGCVRKHVVAPTVTTVRTCQKGQPGC